MTLHLFSEMYQDIVSCLHLIDSHDSDISKEMVSTSTEQ